MPISWRSVFIAALVAGAASACAPQATIAITPLGAERTYPPTPDSATIPLYAVAKPECPYDEIALITAQGVDSGDAILAILRSKARAVGAQAILGYMQSERGATSMRSGSAIHFRSTDCMK